MVAVFRYICVMLKKIILVFLLSFICEYGLCQVDSTFVDPKYLEDQFYFGLSYNRLIDSPSDEFVQNGVSGGFYAGYIRDIPFNKNRNFGIGIGLGYSYNVYVQNIKITQVADDYNYEFIPTDDFDINRFSTKAVEFPFEIRWRTSTATKYSFWRIYTGVKFGYVFSSKSIYEDDSGRIEVEGIDDLENLQYGLTISVGYGSINLNFYYGLNPLFENAKTIDDLPLDMTRLNVGLIFYIL